MTEPLNSQRDSAYEPLKLATAGSALVTAVAVVALALIATDPSLLSAGYYTLVGGVALATTVGLIVTAYLAYKAYQNSHQELPASASRELVLGSAGTPAEEDSAATDVEPIGEAPSAAPEFTPALDEAPSAHSADTLEPASASREPAPEELPAAADTTLDPIPASAPALSPDEAEERALASHIEGDPFDEIDAIFVNQEYQVDEALSLYKEKIFLPRLLCMRAFAVELLGASSTNKAPAIRAAMDELTEALWEKVEKNIINIFSSIPDIGVRKCSLAMLTPAYEELIDTYIPQLCDTMATEGATLASTKTKLAIRLGNAATSDAALDTEIRLTLEREPALYLLRSDRCVAALKALRPFIVNSALAFEKKWIPLFSEQGEANISPWQALKNLRNAFRPLRLAHEEPKRGWFRR